MAVPNLDRVQAVKWESSALGGTEEDTFPTAIEETEDALSARGIYLQPASGGADEDVLVWRDTNDIKLQDKAVGPITLTQIDAKINATQHKALRDLIHFIDDGPCDGFATGSNQETTWSTFFKTNVVWYDKSGEGKKKIVEKIITWTGMNATTKVWKMYDATETLLITVTDKLTYDGYQITGKSRAWA